MKQFLENIINNNKNDKNISLTSLNMKRIRLVAFVFMIFQIVALLGDHIKQYEELRYSSMFCGIFSFITFVALTIIMKTKPSEAVQNSICHIFWIVFTLEMTPFLISDVVWSKSPVNIIIFVTILTMIPVFSPKVILLLYPLPMIYMIFIIDISGADAHMLTSAIVFACAGILMAYLNQSGFYRLVNKLRVESERDHLTGMYNKGAGMSKMLTLLPMCRREKKTVSIFFIDIDYFKNYNDTFGHMKGDRVLIKISDCMQKILSRKTDISARIGGEEFIILLTDTDYDNSLMLAKRLLKSVEALNITSGQGAAYDMVTISIGVALMNTANSPCDEKSLFNMVNEADQLLYRAKTSGRNSIATQEGIFKA